MLREVKPLKARPSSNRRHSERGVSLLEYALVLAILLMGLLGLFKSIEGSVDRAISNSRSVTQTGPCGDILNAVECR